jgi:hypothetical protein
MKKRSDMKPGEMFVVYDRWLPAGYLLLVVIDDKCEVPFWDGGFWCIGDMAPTEMLHMVNE